MPHDKKERRRVSKRVLNSALYMKARLKCGGVANQAVKTLREFAPCSLAKLIVIMRHAFYSPACTSVIWLNEPEETVSKTCCSQLIKVPVKFWQSAVVNSYQILDVPLINCHLNINMGCVLMVWFAVNKLSLSTPVMPVIKIYCLLVIYQAITHI